MNIGFNANRPLVAVVDLNCQSETWMLSFYQMSEARCWMMKFLMWSSLLPPVTVALSSQLSAPCDDGGGSQNEPTLKAASLSHTKRQKEGSARIFPNLLSVGATCVGEGVAGMRASKGGEKLSSCRDSVHTVHLCISCVANYLHLTFIV